jgi:uncharacterized phage-associated protein
MNFNHKKIIQILNYLAKNSNESIDKLKAIKLIWLIDRFHLRKYGRTVTDDFYFAMPYGPVGSASKDYAGGNILDEEEKEYYDNYLKVEGNTIKSVGDIDEEVFSDSDREAMKEVLATYGNCSKSSLIDFSHLFPEWSKLKEAIDGGSQREIMDIKDFFENPDTKEVGLKNIFNEDVDELDCSKKRFEESEEAEKCWL